ncbi:hypothetical protein K8T06_16870 [bacterium]|nr:hypothetical protein [bacterium]
MTINGKRIKVRSVNGPGSCAIDCQNSGCAFYLYYTGENQNTVIQGFTILNGNHIDGGGIVCWGSSPRIDNCIFLEGYSSDGGGGIWCNSDCYSKITNCIISGNEGHNAGGIDCGVYSSIAVTNCIISGNQGHNSGGILVWISSSVSISNCTIIGNSATDGGGISVVADSTLTAANNILWGNTPPEIHESDSSISITYSDIQQSSGTYPGTGNINEDPQFIAAASGDLHLKQMAAGQPSDSPCVDTGSDSADNISFNIPGGTTFMSQLSTRSDSITDSGIVDMGYHYAVSGSSTPTPLPTSTPEPTNTPDECINDGDPNFDGEITASDAQMTFQIVLGSIIPTVDEACAADCNGDSEVTASDAQLIFMTVLGSGECEDN